MSLHFLKLSVAPPWTDLEMVFFSFSFMEGPWKYNWYFKPNETTQGGG